uniref:Prolylcarboxypeptidase n=1 Tax=Paramoeba aestuarina TaxID=180227 RepID=A0A7S4NTB1_9EUKA|mmetsp:Transcript_25762/g.40203  ORF Transcript_25762/g.40203 Transcript_25762/m.40203 type:complete len:489 (+) Transcript_25762:37-1503(+)
MKACLLVVVALVLFSSLGESKRRFSRFKDVSTRRVKSRDQTIPTPDEFFFANLVDHYSFVHPTQTYQMRYLVTDAYYLGKGYPIFFYAGNEGDIYSFYNNTGFMFTLASEFGALVVFAEHRYYGESLPFGNQSYTKENIGYLTSEQAMADYAVFISDYKAQKPELSESKVVVFGGSYGGMLASWLRMRYPNVFVGALAASAPIWQFEGQMPRGGEQFSEVATRDFLLSGPECPTGIRAGFEEIMIQAGRGQPGLDLLTEQFMLCSPLQSDQVYDLVSFLENGYVYMAMTDYPSASNFLQPMPAWPVDVSCQYWLHKKPTSPEELFTAMRLSVGVYYNYTGEAGSCFDINEDISSNLGDQAWNYQACTEMIMPVQTNGKTDMFLPAPWIYSDYVTYCQETFDVTPRPGWTDISFWGHQISAASNIIFSNGMLDPWRPGGVTYNISSSVTAIIIQHGAHHLDLRTPLPSDPLSVQMARSQETEIIRSWLE